MGRAFSRVCLFVSLFSICPRCKRKTASAITTKVGRNIGLVHDRTSACTDPEVKRSNHNRRFKPSRWRWTGMRSNVSVHIDTTAHFLFALLIHVTWPRPFQGWFCHLRLALTTTYLPNLKSLSVPTEDIKGDTKSRVCAVAQYTVLEANAKVNGRSLISHPHPPKTP